MANETTFQKDRIRFAHTEKTGAEHSILITPNVNTSHYIHEDIVSITSVTVKNELLHIEQTDKGTVLHFVCDLGGEFTITLSNVSPEALCDSVEAARLQGVEA